MQNQQVISNDVCQPNQVVGYCQEEHGYFFKIAYHLGLWNGSCQSASPTFRLHKNLNNWFGAVIGKAHVFYKMIYRIERAATNLQSTSDPTKSHQFSFCSGTCCPTLVRKTLVCDRREQRPYFWINAQPTDLHSRFWSSTEMLPNHVLFTKCNQNAWPAWLTLFMNLYEMPE